MAYRSRRRGGWGGLLVGEGGGDHTALRARVRGQQRGGLDEQLDEVVLAGAGRPADEEVRIFERAVPGVEQDWLMRLADAHEYPTWHHERIGEEREHGGERGRIEREGAQ